MLFSILVLAFQDDLEPLNFPIPIMESNRRNRRTSTHHNRADTQPSYFLEASTLAT